MLNWATKALKNAITICKKNQIYKATISFLIKILWLHIERLFKVTRCFHNVLHPQNIIYPLFRPQGLLPAHEQT